MLQKLKPTIRLSRRDLKNYKPDLKEFIGYDSMTDKKDGANSVRSNDLLCCPFCGASGDLRSNKSNKEKPVWNVGCSKATCIAYRPNFWQYDKYKVIDAWNLRAT